LPHYIFIEECASFDGSRKDIKTHIRALAYFFFNDLIAQVDAFITDVDTRSCDEFLDLLLGLATKGALQKFSCVTKLGHEGPPRTVC
jgi:hypothetical protein